MYVNLYAYKSCMNPYKSFITEQIAVEADPDKALWWNNYLKGEVRFIGTSIPQIRRLLLDLDKSQELSLLPMNQQVSIVYGLMRGDLAEEKLAAILFVQLFWLERHRSRFLLDLISEWFDERYIHDWNTTDWLATKILAPLVDTGDELVIWTLKRWNRDSYLWKARASLVAFAQAKSLHRYPREVRVMSDILIRRPERFAKTAVGWVMREYSRIDKDYVNDFLSRHVRYTPSWVKRNALKYHREKST